MDWFTKLFIDEARPALSRYSGARSDLASVLDRTISKISDNNVKNIGSYSCYNCTALKTAKFTAATDIGKNAFYNCSALVTVEFPAVTKIDTYAFYNCSSLVTVEFPAVTKIDTYAFYNCTALTKVDLHEVTEVSSYAFQNTALNALILRNTKKVSTLSGTSAFAETPIASGTGYIYVPAALVNNYKLESNWSNFANQIRALEDYPEITGG